MTKREFFEQVIALVDNEEVKAHAEHEIELLNARNERRKTQPNKNTLANEPIKEQIVQFLNGKGFTVSREIASGCDISTNKAVALCKQLVESEVLEVTEVKEKGGRKVKAFKVRQPKVKKWEW